MKIILVTTDTRRKNLVFVSEELKSFSLEEAIDLAQDGKIEGVCAVNRSAGTYLRTKPSVPKSEEFETLSITGRNLLSYAQDARHAVSTPALSRYVELYLASLKEGKLFIKPVGRPKVLTAAVKEKFTPHRSYIFAAAKKFDIDPKLLGAIIIDEIARLAPFEEIINALEAHIVGLNVSIGIAQVKIDTAHDLIKKGVYHPNPDDMKLPFKRLTNASRAYLYVYLIQPKHNIFFAAGFIRFVIDFWKVEINLAKRPEIIATLYHQGYGKPHPKPESDERGEQITKEFYRLSKRWLREK